jgi:hypothetical protein
MLQVEAGGRNTCLGGRNARLRFEIRVWGVQRCGWRLRGGGGGLRRVAGGQKRVMVGPRGCGGSKTGGGGLIRVAGASKRVVVGPKWVLVG